MVLYNGTIQSHTDSICPSISCMWSWYILHIPVPSHVLALFPSHTVHGRWFCWFARKHWCIIYNDRRFSLTTHFLVHIRCKRQRGRRFSSACVEVVLIVLVLTTIVVDSTIGNSVGSSREVLLLLSSLSLLPVLWFLTLMWLDRWTAVCLG